jgi:hypothetical protein
MCWVRNSNRSVPFSQRICPAPRFTSRTRFSNSGTTSRCTSTSWIFQIESSSHNSTTPSSNFLTAFPKDMPPGREKRRSIQILHSRPGAHQTISISLFVGKRIAQNLKFLHKNKNLNHFCYYRSVTNFPLASFTLRPYKDYLFYPPWGIHLL